MKVIVLSYVYTTLMKVNIVRVVTLVDKDIPNVYCRSKKYCGCDKVKLY